MPSWLEDDGTLKQAEGAVFLNKSQIIELEVLKKKKKAKIVSMHNIRHVLTIDNVNIFK